jgi:hypothetical protein
MSNQQRSDDQLLLNEMGPECIYRVEAFISGRLQIWSDAEERQDSFGNVYTIRSAGWREVRGAFAIFVRGAKYRIVGAESWRVPIDEDAKCRPSIRMRDADQEPWKKGTLVAVNDLLDRDHNYLVHHGNNVFEWFIQCEILDNAEATANA